MSFASGLLLTLALVGAAATLTVHVRGRRLGWGNAFWFLASWLTGELALFHLVLSALVLTAFAIFTHALSQPAGRWAAAIIGLSWLGLLIAQWRTRTARDVLEQALRAALGDDYRAHIPEDRRARIPDDLSIARLARPFHLRDTEVEWLRDIPYGDAHSRQRLDIYRPRGDVRGAPVLLQIHGGAWVIGDKREQALPLIHFLVARGWVVVATNYRLSPAHRFPTHLIDCKRALAWTREHIGGYGGDAGFVAVTGGSAGGHLATLVALTANRADLQPGFESADTSVAACVPFYGVYDFVDRHKLQGSGELVVDWLARTVMPGPPAQDPALWDLASPITQLHGAAPPFFVLHGTHDSLASVDTARRFTEELRRHSPHPVAYAELPGAQHAWEIFHTVRATRSTQAVARFLEWCRATQDARA